MNNNNKEYTERRGSLLLLSLAIIFIILILVIGVCVLLFVDKYVAKIVLFSLIGLLVFLAILSLIFLEMQRKEAQRKRDQGATELVKQMYEQQRNHIETTRSSYSVDYKTSTWALTQPWRYSQRSTLRADSA